MAPKTVDWLDEYTPEHLFAEDHFKALLHVDAICAELNDGFEIGFDSRMRLNKRMLNALYKNAPNPKRPANYPPYKPGKHGKIVTILKDGTQVINGDDMCCIHDMAEVGYIARIINGEYRRAEAIHVGIRTVIYLSPRGKQVVQAVKQAISENGHCNNFTPPPAIDGDDLLPIKVDELYRLQMDKM